MMVLYNKNEVRRELKLKVLTKIKKHQNIEEVKNVLKEKSRQILIPEGSPDSRTSRIKDNIHQIREYANRKAKESSSLLMSLEDEASKCVKLPVSYENPNISNAQVSENRCYGFLFSELLEIIKENPDRII